MQRTYIKPHTEVVKGKMEALLIKIGSLEGESIPEGGYLTPKQNKFITDDEEISQIY